MNSIQEKQFVEQFLNITSETFQGRYNYNRQEIKADLEQSIYHCQQNKSNQYDNLLSLQHILLKNQLNLRFFALTELYIKIHQTVQNNQVANKCLHCYLEWELNPDYKQNMKKIQHNIFNFMKSTLINNILIV